MWPTTSPASGASVSKATKVNPDNIVTVASGSISAYTTLGGTIVPYKEVSLSSQMPGRIQFLAGIEGDWFEEGSLLVALTNNDLLAKWRSAQAQLAKAQAGFRNARVQYTREVIAGPDFSRQTGMGVGRMVDEMFTNPFSEMMGYTSPELARRASIYNSGTNIDQARFSLMQAQAGIQELNAKLRDTKTIAPFDGVIVRKFIEKGDTVQPGMPLLAYADTRHLQIQVDVPARLMRGIQKDMTIPAKVDVSDVIVNTRVAQIFPMADPQRHTITVKLDLPEDAPGGPGIYAEVTIPDVASPQKNESPIIPRSAVIWRGSLPNVMLVNGNNEPVLRIVRLGGVLPGSDMVSVLSGLTAGERIVKHPTTAMRKGWKKSQ
ncbi:MAG: efflux RND transporter periplasmic adaptor subunit [Magnetococcales bacterium]|nr:efflux RND transporter periplasmic adaptor subunit [Magnetococcales bacterium]